MTNAMMEVLKMEQTWFQQGRDQGISQGISQGAQEAMAQAVLMTLEARGLNVDDMSRQRVLSCHDLPTLKRWIVKAATAPRIEDVLA